MLIGQRREEEMYTILKMLSKGIKPFLLIIFILLYITTSANAVKVPVGMQFVVQNETYTVTHTMNFHTITIDDTYIIFNTTGFHITSANPITVSLSYIHANIVSANDKDKVLEFYATTSSGSVVFNLSGFPVNTKYDVICGGIILSSVSADGTGFLSFTNSAWGTSQLFAIHQNGSIPEPPPPSPPPPSPQPPSPPPPSNPPQNEATTNRPPRAVFESYGPLFVELNKEYMYTVSTTDPDSDQIRYRFDWGDGTVSSWSTFVESGTSISFTHSWAHNNAFQVQVIAQDEHGLNSSWSSLYTVFVAGIGNQSRSPPVSIINVSEEIFVNESVIFDALGIFHSDNINLSYSWDFGDGTTRSGINPVHVFSQPGQYKVILIGTDNMGNTYTKQLMVTVAAATPLNESEEQQHFLLANLSFVIFGLILSVLIGLTMVFRNRIRMLF